MFRDVPSELEWFANIRNPNTRRAYRRDVQQFVRFTGIEEPGEFRHVTRAQVIAWRDELESQGLAAATVRRKMSAIASLFDFLCERHSVETNPVHGAARPNEGANEGKTSAISDDQALRLLEAPDEHTLKGRRQELCDLRVRDVQERRGMPHLHVRGKGGKIRLLPIEPEALRRIREYLEVAGHGEQRDAPLFQRVKGNDGRSLHPGSVYDQVVKRYAERAGIDPAVFSPHSLRATAATSATSAIEGGADLETVRDWLGRASIAATTIYDKRRHRPEDSPTFAVSYRRRSRRHAER